MKKISYNWKYMLAGLMLVGFSACSNDSEGLLSSESTEVSRSSELVTQTIDLGTEPGTLQSKLEAAMSDVSTLQKLVLTGEYNEADANYWLSNLTALIEFDLSGATPKHSQNEDTYASSSYSGMTFNDNTIGSYLFYGMTNLETLVLPTTVTEIHSYACADCTSLTSVTIPDGVTYLGYYAFANTNLSSVTIPSSVTNIDSEIFVNNQNLTSVELKANVSAVSSSMFYNCSKLETVVLSSSIEEVYGSAFENCSSLKDYTPFLQIKKIHGSAFHASGIVSADLSNVTDFSNAGWAFRLCESLESVILPDGLTETLPGAMFWGCTKLSSINFPAGMETIGDQVFGGCGFTELTIPATVKHINYDAFTYNRSLTKVTLSEGLETIDSYAFRETAITEITIPSTVTTIGHGAFERTNLTTLTVPATVTEVGGSLIDYCSGLNALVWNSSAPVNDPWSINSNCYLYLANADVVVGPNWKNIIVDGVAENIELCADGNRTDSNTSFNVPIAFTAKKISFSRYFDAYTYPGISSGWQTIVLPFTPTTIEHESKGAVAPFNSGVADAKPFWLRELTADGFVDKTTMEPDKAYIIAMPNHDDYIDEYRLNGKITFSAENVELAATPAVLPASDGPEYSLQPTYNFVQRGVSVYALNVDYSIDGYEWGAVFARNIVDVYAFEAYVTTAGRSARSLFGMDTRSKASRTPYSPNKTGIPQIGDM